MAFEPGNRIGDYEVVQVLGAGGMGKVYKVRNVISDRVEAMKVLLPNLEGDPELADRFIREIKVQASLQHPNIAALHTAARVENQLLMLMEFVEGTSLDKLLKQGPMSAPEAIRVTIATLEALGYAHERGIIHRDIKPANIMLTPQGHVKLMDFGIARLASDPRVTQTGRTVGSLFYMSPEQINGKQLDARSDLYSLGISLYEMVTGKRPFDGDSDFSIMAAHLQQMPIPPVELDPRVPAPLNELILTSLAKNPDERFQSAAAFRKALLSLGPTMSQSVPSQTLPLPQAVSIPPGTPTPSPAFTPQPAPPPPPAPAFAQGPVVSTAPPPPAVQPGSSRPLWIILGSVATLGAIALGIWLVPRFLGTQAGGSSAAPPSTQTYQPPPEPATEPASSAEPSSAPGGGASAGLSSTAVAPSSPAPAIAQPALPGRAAPPSQSGSLPPGMSMTGRITPGGPVSSASPSPAASSTSPAATQQAAPASSAPAAAVQPPPAPPSAPPGASAAQLNELRERFNELSIRMGACADSLRSIEQNQAAMGVGLRGDIREARTRHQYQMREAQQYLQAGNVEGARRALDYAERALEQIEKFLNR
jgi:serine/threonine-protein kinase